MKKRLKKIAQQIVELEKKAQNDKSFDYESAMMKILVVNKISPTDMLAIDDYIQKEKLLTK